MKAWAEWFPDVMLVAPGCSDLLATAEISRAARTFFTDSRAWRAELESVALTAGDKTVEIVPDDNTTAIVRVEEVGLGDEPLGDMTDGVDSGWQDQVGTPVKFFQMTPGVLRLVPYPDVALTDLLQPVVSLRPSDAATGIPDELFGTYREQIASGAKAAVLLMAAQPWANPDLGMAYSGAFREAIDLAKSRAAIAFGKRRKRASRIKWC